jgi:serine acetyltransferase
MSGVRIDRPAIAWVFQDWSVNGAWDSRIVLVRFRLAQYLFARAGVVGRIWGFGYRMMSSLVVGVELAPELVAGPRLRIHHPQSIVVNAGSVLGADCVLRQNVTIGNIVRRNGDVTDAPIIGDRVEFGAGCVVIGAITIGDDARVGALSLVREDVPARSTAVGNPARLIETPSTRNLS